MTEYTWLALVAWVYWVCVPDSDSDRGLMERWELLAQIEYPMS